MGGVDQCGGGEWWRNNSLVGDREPLVGGQRRSSSWAAGGDPPRGQRRSCSWAGPSVAQELLAGGYLLLETAGRGDAGDGRRRKEMGA